MFDEDFEISVLPGVAIKYLAVMNEFHITTTLSHYRKIHMRSVNSRRIDNSRLDIGYLTYLKCGFFSHEKAP